MEFEHSVVEIPLDENCERKLKALASEGWGLVPGTVPIGVYQLVRVKQQNDIGMQVKMDINDDKILVLKADGSLQ